MTQTKVNDKIKEDKGYTQQIFDEVDCKSIEYPVLNIETKQWFKIIKGCTQQNNNNYLLIIRNDLLNRILGSLFEN